MPVFGSLDIHDDVRRAIASGIFTAITNDISEIIYEHSLPTSNGASLFRWNFINRNVSANLGGQFQTSYITRGPWKFLLLFEQTLGFTFSIMTEKNFARLQRRLPRGIHYLEALTSKNTGYDVVEGQMKLDFDESKRDPSAVEQLRDQLLNNVAGIVKNHILILFDYDFSRVVSARAVFPTPDFDIAYSKDWSNFLNKHYVINKTSIIKEMIADDAEPLVKLKPEMQERVADDIVLLPVELEAVN